MGVIKDGSISGVLPEKEGFAVHYPGYPSSTSRAVETLGGIEGIIKARSSQSNSLELHFRPEDPYSHPAFGELRPCSSLLLRISKKKSSDDQDALVSESMSTFSSTKTNLEPVSCSPESAQHGQQSSGPVTAISAVKKSNEVQIQEEAVSTHLSAEIVARVSEAYNFNGMVDYQHVLSVHADVARRKRCREDVQPDIVNKSGFRNESASGEFEKGGLMDVYREELMILVPPLFSPKDMPEKLVLKPLTTLSSKKKQEAIVQQRWEMDIAPCLAIDCNIEEIPSKVNWEDYVPRGSDSWNWQMVVAKLFDERPIWTKHSLIERLHDESLHFGVHLLKRLLFRTAYYFSTGPFRLFWIRKGYDPRKDPESRIYQSVDFRVPPSLRNIEDVNTTDKFKHKWKDLCTFQVFPWKCQTSFQLSELVDDYIQQEIRKPPKQMTCSCSTGWFSSDVLDILRLRVAVRFLSIYPKEGAKDLLKSASDRFEKLRRAHALKRDLRPEEENQYVNKDSSSCATRVSPIKHNGTEMVSDDGKYESDEDDNDGYDEIGEVENEEEDLDEYDSPHLDGDGGNFSLQPCSYPIGKNISTNYLQELFGSFPSTEAGNSNMQYADSSDDEYQIFEQDSGDNDNYSDDDDR